MDWFSMGMKKLLVILLLLLVPELSRGANPSGAGSANTLPKWTTASNIGFITNGVGILTNNGAGGIGFSLSPLVWTNDNLLFHLRGFPEVITNRYAKINLQDAGEIEAEFQGANDTGSRARIRLHSGATAADVSQSTLSIIGTSTADNWNIQFNSGTNGSADEMKFTMTKNSYGDALSMEPTIASGSGNPAYFFDTIYSLTDPADLLLSIRHRGTNEFRIDRLGAISLSAQTNKLSIANNQLLLDGVPISGGTEAAPVNNFYSTNVFFQSGRGNTLIVTQQLTLNYLKTNLLATDASGNVTTTKFGAGISWDPATQTISSSVSGDTTATNIVTLTQTGTNISAMDFSLVSRGGAFKITLTNNAFMPTPSGLATTPFTKAWLLVQQPSTGTCLVTFTNASFAWPNGSVPINDTNNGAVSVYEFVSDVFTNGIAHGSMSPRSKLP